MRGGTIMKSHVFFRRRGGGVDSWARATYRRVLHRFKNSIVMQMSPLAAVFTCFWVTACLRNRPPRLSELDFFWECLVFSREPRSAIRHGMLWGHRNRRKLELFALTNVIYILNQSEPVRGPLEDWVGRRWFCKMVTNAGFEDVRYRYYTHISGYKVHLTIILFSDGTT